MCTKCWLTTVYISAPRLFQKWCSLCSLIKARTLIMRLGMETACLKERFGIGLLRRAVRAIFMLTRYTLSSGLPNCLLAFGSVCHFVWSTRLGGITNMQTLTENIWAHQDGNPGWMAHLVIRIKVTTTKPQCHKMKATTHKHAHTQTDNWKACKRDCNC